jgi:hypothetical protein
MAVDVAPPEPSVSPEPAAKVNRDRDLLVDAQRRGFFPTLGAYVRLSGPGWLQSAITLGGGSLASAMYLGVLTGLSMLWLQPFAMILGVVMLSAIAYVTTTTGKRPFGLINRRLNPVLGWSWALASLAANMVWSMPQYALSTDVLEKNLLPSGFLSQLDSFWAGDSAGVVSPRLGRRRGDDHGDIVRPHLRRLDRGRLDVRERRLGNQGLRDDPQDHGARRRRLLRRRRRGAP